MVDSREEDDDLTVKTLDLIKTRQIRQVRIKARPSGKVKVRPKVEVVIIEMAIVEEDSKELFILVVKEGIYYLNVRILPAKAIPCTIKMC